MLVIAKVICDIKISVKMFFQIILILLLIFLQKGVFNFNEEPYRELQSDNDQGQRNVGTLNKYAHGKQAFTFLLLIRKILPFSWK